jgi:hypothetical protein
MWWQFVSARKRACFRLAIFGIGALAASFLPFWGDDRVPGRSVSPAETVASRFPSAWSVARGSRAASPALTVHASDSPVSPSLPLLVSAGGWAETGGNEVQLASKMMFSPHSTYPIASVSAPNSAVAGAPAAAARPPERRTPSPRPPRDPNALFNEAQIASLKERLALSADQEPYWPAIASALRTLSRRQIVVVKTTAHGADLRIATIDGNSVDVAQLKIAALPLITTLREEQKREVNALAHLVGLGSVAARF